MKKIFLVLLLILLSGCTARVRDGGEVLVFGGHENVPPVVSVQNEFLRLEFLTETAEIVLTELATGNVWRSSPEGIGSDPHTEPVERKIGQSLFVLEYQDRTGTMRPFYAHEHSVETGRFEHEIIGDVLEVRFTVGNIKKTYRIPDAIYVDKLEELMENAGLERFMRNLVRGDFDIIEYGKAARNFSASELLSIFPTLEEGRTIYWLRDDVAVFQLEEVEEILESIGYTQQDWEEDMEYFAIGLELKRPTFNVIMRFELDRNNMVVTVPLNEITYINEFMPTQINIMPYFGAALETENPDEYLFVPDGSGSLIYFDSGRFTQGIFGSYMYGWDEAIIRDSVLHDNRAAFPVFGIHANDSTFACIIDEGSSYAFIRAEAGGLNSQYNRVFPMFRLLHGAPMEIAVVSNDSMFLHEWELPDENLVLRYAITQGNGYVGMAEEYRAFLQERYPWLNQRVSQPVNAMVEFLGSALSPQYFLGFPVDRPYALTSYNRAAEIMETLDGFGWSNLHVQMLGAHNKSIDHAVPTSLNLISQLGGRNGFNNMVNTAENLGYEFYLEGDFFFMRGDKTFDGFRPMRDAARQANRKRVEHYGYSSVYFGALGSGLVMADPIILARPSFMLDTAQNFVNEAENRGVNNMSFRSMANALAGDFNEDRHVTREESMNMRSDFLSGLRDNGTGIWLNYGFAYGAPYADIITGMPLTDQSFGVTDIDVPFYQIALHGIVPYAGRPLNLAEDNSTHYLKSIASGALLFYSFMDVPTLDIEVTRYLRYFSNEFDRWQNVADRLYQDYVRELGHVYNQYITDHQILSRDGVTVTVYEDGTRVYVNTSTLDFVDASGITINARSWNVVK